MDLCFFFFGYFGCLSFHFGYLSTKIDTLIIEEYIFTFITFPISLPCSYPHFSKNKVSRICIYIHVHAHVRFLAYKVPKTGSFQSLLSWKLHFSGTSLIANYQAPEALFLAFTLSISTLEHVFPMSPHERDFLP